LGQIVAIVDPADGSQHEPGVWILDRVRLDGR
jgi:hypothetical protein